MPGPTVLIEIYRRAAASSSVEVKIADENSPSKEDVLLNSQATEIVGMPVESEIREWLTEWWQP